MFASQLLPTTTAGADGDATPEYAYQLGQEYFDAIEAANIAAYNAAGPEFWNPQLFLKQDDVTPTVQALADEVTDGAISEWDKLYNIHEWVAGNIHYDEDALYGRDTCYIKPDDVIKYRRTICAGYANLLIAMCHAVGLPARGVSGFCYNGVENAQEFVNNIEGGSFDHEWSEVFVSGEWIIVDATYSSNNVYRNGVYHTGKCISLTKVPIKDWTTSKNLGAVTLYQGRYITRYVDYLKHNNMSIQICSRGLNSGYALRAVHKHEEHFTVPNFVIKMVNTRLGGQGPRLTSITIPPTVKGEIIVYENEKIETVYGVPGTSAEAFANKNGYTFVPVDSPIIPKRGSALSVSGEYLYSGKANITVGELKSELVDPDCVVLDEEGEELPDTSPVLTGYTIRKTGDIGNKTKEIVVSGDVNLDNLVNNLDASIILQYDAGIRKLGCTNEMADVNKDGLVNNLDAALILKYDAGLVERF